MSTGRALDPLGTVLMILLVLFFIAALCFIKEVWRFTVFASNVGTIVATLDPDRKDEIMYRFMTDLEKIYKTHYMTKDCMGKTVGKVSQTYSDQYEAKAKEL